MALLTTLVTLSIVAVVAAWSPTDPVLTTSGHITGQSSDWKPQVSEYLGIPFAQSPTGPLRFAPPVKYTSSAHHSATKFSPQCPGNVHFNGTISYASVADTVRTTLGQAGGVFNEDCLTVNIWTKPQTGEKKKAVMVWIYGGGFNSGNTDSVSYNGARLAEEKDVVLVSLNYRVHIFGFPGAPGMVDRNPGLLDQRMALEWIRDNIEKFGGDASRITIFGQSAGGVSVDLHTYAWAQDPIAHAFIPSSGSVSDGTVGAVKGQSWFAASQKLGCGGNGTALESQLSCMRTKSMNEILAVSTVGPRLGGFGPAADGKVVFRDYNVRRAAGNFARRPLLVGNTNHEAGLYEMLGQPSPFGAARPGINCLSHNSAKARQDAGVSAWRYLYAGEWPNTDIGKPGAWHGADIITWFGTGERLTRVADTEEEKKFVEVMMNAWTTFAKDPEKGLLSLGWPKYDGGKSVIRLGGKDRNEVVFREHAVVDSGPGGC